MKLYTKLTEFLNRPIKNKHLRLGVPFIAFMAIALTVMRECATVRYEFRKTETIDRNELKRLGFKVPDRPETLEEAYEKYKEIDIDNWENKRGPRFWDETPQN